MKQSKLEGKKSYASDASVFTDATTWRKIQEHLSG
jgi:hypothetical protein